MEPLLRHLSLHWPRSTGGEENHWADAGWRLTKVVGKIESILTRACIM